MNLLFLDTEFSGLGQRGPLLISIGLVSEHGEHSFYAELPADCYLDKAIPWVRANILPLLEGGEFVMEPETLREQLAQWVAALGSVRIVTDAPDLDFAFLRAILDPLPANVHPKPIRFDSLSLGDQYRAVLETYRCACFSSTKPEHHARHDAQALCQMWARARTLDAFHAFAARLGVPP